MKFSLLTSAPHFPSDNIQETKVWMCGKKVKGRHSRCLKVKRAKELELVVVDKRANRGKRVKGT